MRLHNIFFGILLSCSFIFNSFSLKGQDVWPGAKKPLLEHLKIINEDWSLPANYSEELDLEVIFKTDNEVVTDFVYSSDLFKKVRQMYIEERN
mgnify:CR=1 FL=1